MFSIHPFYDGNGRSSRLLMNYIQQLFDLPMAIVFVEDRAAYFEALLETRKTADMAIFHHFMYNQYQKYLEQEITAYQKLSKDTSSKGYSYVF